MQKKVYLVGAGPGDPELLTVKAAKVLATARVVLYDRLVSQEVLALVNPEARLIYAGKERGEQDQVQPWILEQLLFHAQQSGLVVRLKSGDPCVFGRGGDEWHFLRSHGIEVEVVPGLTSAVAAPTACGIPLTFRGLSRAFAVITGHCQQDTPIDWRRYAGVDTLVVLMGVAERAAIARSLISAGRLPAEPVAFLERATTPQERVVTATLDQVARGLVEIHAPAVFVIGWVAALRDELRTAVGGSTEFLPQPISNTPYVQTIAGD